MKSSAGDGERRRPVHRTRNRPRRATELLDGGSLYWVIRGIIRVRQRLLAIDTVTDGDHRFCTLTLDPLLVPTLPRRHRAFQGWRYLSAADAPADDGSGGAAADMPAEMRHALAEMGIL